MRNLFWLIAILLLLLIQTGILLPLGLFPVNLALVLVVVATLVSDFDSALIIAFTAGILLDLASGPADGIISLTMLTVFLLLCLVLNFFLSKEANQVMLFSSVAAATIVYFLIFLLFNRIFGLFHLGHAIELKYFLGHLLPITLAFNLLLTYPIFRYYLFVSWQIRSRLKTKG